TLLRNVGHPALAFRIGPAGETLRGDDAAERIARAVTFGAMAKTVDKIGAAIPGGRMRGIGDKRFAVEEQQLPHADRGADVEWKRQIVIAYPALNDRKRLEISEEIAHVLNLGPLIGCVRKSRVEMRPRR